MRFSPSNGNPDVLISECGPRDGLQILSTIMPTEAKKRWIKALYAAGLREIEICSFVLAKRMPQMADAAEIGAAHMHNTRGLGLANNLAAYDAGMRIFDSSLGGLGGCPRAPGASGNVATEDIVFMFEAMGIRTGIDLEKLMEARRPMRDDLPGVEVYGMLAEAGLPKGFGETASRMSA